MDITIDKIKLGKASSSKIITKSRSSKLKISFTFCQQLSISRLYQGSKEIAKYPTDFESKTWAYPHNALPAYGLHFQCFMEDSVLLMVLVTNDEAFVPVLKFWERDFSQLLGSN